MNQAGAAVGGVTNRAGRGLFFSVGCSVHCAVARTLFLFSVLRKMLNNCACDSLATGSKIKQNI